MPRDEESSNYNQQHSTGYFYSVEVASKARVETEKAIDADRGQEERDSDAHRIDGQKKDAATDAVLRTGNRKNGSQDWTDAGGPAKSESESDDKRSPNSLASPNAVHPLVSVERVDFQQPSKMKTKQNDDHTG